jgi:hypothetical protein
LSVSWQPSRSFADRVPVAGLWWTTLSNSRFGQPIEVWPTCSVLGEGEYDFICLLSGILDLGQTVALAHARARDDRYDTDDRATEWAEEGTGQIRNMADVESYPWPAVEALVPAHLTEVGRYLPDGMKAIATTGKVFTAAWQLMGFEAFCLAIHDQPDVVEAL